MFYNLLHGYCRGMTRITAKIYHKLIRFLYKPAYAVIAEAKSHLVHA
jgi:hypothetical protein